jgi:signal transduction histidine kinase
MTNRTLAIVLLALTSVGVALSVCLAILLPALGALPPREQEVPPLWSYLAPLTACLAAAVPSLRRRRPHRLPHVTAERLADLPGQTMTLFALVATAGILAGAFVEPTPLHEQRPAVTLICGPALAFAHAMVLRFLVQAPLMYEVEQTLARAGGHGGSRERSGAALGVFALRPTVAITTVTLSAVALALIGVHTYSRVQGDRDAAAERHLADLLRVVEAQLEALPHEARAPFVANYPISTVAMPLLVDAQGRALTSAMGISRGAGLALRARSCTTSDGRRHRCAVSRRAAPLPVVVEPPEERGAAPVVAALRNDLLQLSAGLLLFAALLGLAIGGDTARDFRTMTTQIRAMAHQDEPDLGRPVPVTSIDEVGDLTAEIGRLRLRLEAELEEYRSSLRKVREADRIKNRFFSDVSHELRTPLTTICGYSQMLAEGLVGQTTDAQREDLKIIYQSGYQLLSLVNDVLDISVIQSGHLNLCLETVELGPLCRDIVRGQTAVVRKKSEDSGLPLELKLELAPELPTIIGDPMRLRRVVQNLLSNAIKFTRQGEITVSVMRHDHARVSIGVCDTGVGIGAADLPQVFERYRQVGAMSARREGTGLGLGICKHLVELHDGEIIVESELDKGTRFTVLLPVSGPEPRSVESKT